MPRTTTTPTSIPSHDMLSSTPRPLERGLSTSGSRWFIASLRSLQLSDERKLSAKVPMGRVHCNFMLSSWNDIDWTDGKTAEPLKASWSYPYQHYMLLTDRRRHSLARPTCKCYAPQIAAYLVSLIERSRATRKAMSSGSFSLSCLFVRSLNSVARSPGRTVGCSSIVFIGGFCFGFSGTMR